ncbi:methanol dehydrogenase [Sphingomonas sp. Root710]|uniref:TPM domain-containing protein n=1 Tax=Sphingomonas sp. Root710 TaxID=1736594 RepID=UPI0006F4A734|nr:TPM domain-containing protein [Sphingomonas sp. Root710]KRB79897.1 methanol dehydrogenase [Sphingomonas sp. Root710]
MIVLLALLLGFFLALPAFAQTFPLLTGRVVDQAKLLSPEQAAALDAKLAALEQQSGHQMVVATVASLQDYPIEDYGYRLGRAWGLGDKKANDGLILLVAPTERKVRIEVGYGLEPIVTDALSSVIIQRQILPRFREGDMAGGIVAGAGALVQLLQLPPDQAQARAQQLVEQDRKAEKGGVPISLIFWIIVILFIFGSSIFNRFGGGRRYRGGAGPVVIWGGGGWGGGSGGGWGGGGGGGFSGGGGSFGGGGSSGSW